MAGLMGATDGSHFMRPFALGATAFLITINILYMATGGSYSSPDRWSDVYMVILAIYAGAPEIKRWATATEAEDPNSLPEKIRKGGPLITLWILLLSAAGFLRIADHTRPMPPELKETTLKVIGVFFGTYALRQYRRTAAGRRGVSKTDESLEDPDEQKIMGYISTHGPQTPKALSDALSISRRSVARLLKHLTDIKRLDRQGGPFDPSATYRTV